MQPNQFRITVGVIAVGFTLLFAIVVVPPLIENPDVPGAFASGFVNPYAAGYSSDVIACWLILAAWVFHERSSKSIRHGWVCLIVGIVPGVAVGLAGYLICRSVQLKD